MRHRCRNPKNPFYKKYGAKGITVCDDWYDSFAAFLSDMGKRPDPTYTLDRIDGSQGYSKANCRWATRSQQNTNQTRTKRGKNKPPITYRGETRTMKEWAAMLGITPTSLSHRIHDYGWTMDEAMGFVPRVSVKGHPRVRFITHNGITKHSSEWAAEAGLKLDTFLHRYRKGWDWDRIFSEPVDTRKGKRRQ